MAERRKVDRREFSEYLRVMNEHTGELVGHLADLSTGGFKLESKHPIDPNVDFILRMDMTSDISDKDHLVFAARSRWCRTDHVDPTLFNIGFQIVEIAPEDLQAFIRIFEKHSRQSENNKDDKKADYLWR